MKEKAFSLAKYNLQHSRSYDDTSQNRNQKHLNKFLQKITENRYPTKTVRNTATSKIRNNSFNNNADLN